MSDEEGESGASADRGDGDGSESSGSDVAGSESSGSDVADSESGGSDVVDSESSESDATADPSRHERLARHPTAGPRNSLWNWTAARHPLRVALHYAVIVLCRVCPSMRLKNWLLRRIGVDVGAGAVFALESTPDVFWPELVTVEADAIVGYDATLLCHEFLQSEYRTGEVVVGERAMIGAGAIVLPGVEIGADAQVAANSLVAEDVPPETTVAGVPAEPIEREAS